jgi:hypothetical protein
MRRRYRRGKYSNHDQNAVTLPRTFKKPEGMDSMLLPLRGFHEPITSSLLTPGTACVYRAQVSLLRLRSTEDMLCNHMKQGLQAGGRPENNPPRAMSSHLLLVKTCVSYLSNDIGSMYPSRAWLRSGEESENWPVLANYSAWLPCKGL